MSGIGIILAPSITIIGRFGLAAEALGQCAVFARSLRCHDDVVELEHDVAGISKSRGKDPERD